MTTAVVAQSLAVYRPEQHILCIDRSRYVIGTPAHTVFKARAFGAEAPGKKAGKISTTT